MIGVIRRVIVGTLLLILLATTKLTMLFEKMISLYSIRIEEPRDRGRLRLGGSFGASFLMELTSGLI